MTPTTATIAPLPAGFADWHGLLGLITRAFAFMDGVIDPPSSARLLTAESLAAKADAETCFTAYANGRLAGCLFAVTRGDVLYVGKLAVDPALQGAGIGRGLVAAAADLAAAMGLPALELQTRVELTVNQRWFESLGFREVARTAHAGYDRPTAITYRRPLT